MTPDEINNWAGNGQNPEPANSGQAQPVQTPQIDAPLEPLQANEPPAPDQPMAGKPKKKLFMILGIAVIVLVLAAAGVFAFMQMQMPKEEMVMEEPSPTPEAMVEEDEMSGWETYTNIDFGMSFSSPNYLITCSSSSQISIRTIEQCNSSGAPENSLGVSKVVEDNQLFSYLKDMQVGETKDGRTEGERLAGVTYERVSDSSIGGLATKNFLQNRSQEVGVYQSFSFVENSGATYQIAQRYLKDYPNDYEIEFEKVFDQILSTFEFVDGQNSIVNGVELKDIGFVLPQSWTSDLNENDVLLSAEGGGYLSISIYNYDGISGAEKAYYCQITEYCTGSTDYEETQIGNISGYKASSLDNSGGGPEYFGSKGNKFYIISSYNPPSPNNFEETFQNVLDSLKF